MSEAGYNAMVQALKDYLKTLDYTDDNNKKL